MEVKFEISDAWSTDENPSTNLTIHEFYKICRICLMEGDLKPIFGTAYNEMPVWEILNICTTVQIQEEDYLPQNICSSCLSKIFKMYTFFQKCQESDAVLRYIVDLNTNQVPIKDELKEVGNDLEDLLHRSNSPLEIIKDELDNNITEINTPLDVANNELDNNITDIRTKQKIRVKKQLRRKHFTPGQTLFQHTQIHTDVCPICAKIITNRKLRQHMRVHTKEKPFKCLICAQPFSDSGNLKRHMMTHTGERPHLCDICGKRFTQATKLLNHKKTHSEFEMCAGESSGSRFNCDYCGRGFKRLANYNLHLRKHDSTAGAIKTLIDDNSMKSYEYICEICSRGCKTKHILKAHKRTHGEKSFLCNECGKSFVKKGGLESHLKVHTGEKPYCCNICQKAFAHVGNFEAHLLIHTGHKPYQCTVCEKTFTQLTHLKHHTRIHSGEKPYECLYCGKTFALKNNLNVHTRIHTGETPFVCSVCDKGFYDSSSMKKHKRGHANSNESAEVNGVQQLVSQPLQVTTENSLDVSQPGMY